MIYNINFSPTGGTKKISEIICGEWNDYVEIDLTNPGTDYSKLSFTKDDLCIFSVPVYEGMITQPVQERIKKMNASATPSVIVTVFGNRAFENAVIQMQDILIETGFVPFAAMAVSIRHTFLKGIASDRPTDSDIEEINKFASDIRAKYDRRDFSIPAVPGDKSYLEKVITKLYPLFERDKCTKCGVCAEKCPIMAIDANDLSVTDETRCVTCSRCTYICPTGARHLNMNIIGPFVKENGWRYAEKKPNEIWL